MLTRIFAALGMLAIASTAEAADIKLASLNDINVITITGRFELGDERKFDRISLPLKSAVVVLNSEGGFLSPGLEIGRQIRRKRFATMVDTLRGSCSSACGFAWLAGSPRMLDIGSKVGFHAAYILGGGKAEVTSAGNAIVGAYLRDLGLPDAAIAFVTSAQPHEMRWLSADDARSIGVEIQYVRVVPINRIKMPSESK